MLDNLATETEKHVPSSAALHEVGRALGDDLEISQATERVRESDRPFLCADTTRIERETSWQPRTEFVDGLGDLLRAEDLRWRARRDGQQRRGVRERNQ